MLAAAQMTACVAARSPFNNGGAVIRVGRGSGHVGATPAPGARRARAVRVRAAGNPGRGGKPSKKLVKRKKTEFIEQDNEKDILAEAMRAASAAASSASSPAEADPTPRMIQSEFEAKLAAAKEKGQAVTEYRKAQEPTTMDGIIAGGWGGKDRKGGGRGLHSFTFQLNLSRVRLMNTPYTRAYTSYTPLTPP